jgi:hypothetical protein
MNRFPDRMLSKSTPALVFWVRYKNEEEEGDCENHQGNHSIKEVFQPHLPVRLPCYDLAPVIGFALGDSLR